MAALAFCEGRLPRSSWLDLPAEDSAQAGATPTITLPPCPSKASPHPTRHQLWKRQPFTWV